jgi:hypothetical protein
MEREAAIKWEEPKNSNTEVMDKINNNMGNTEDPEEDFLNLDNKIHLIILHLVVLMEEMVLKVEIKVVHMEEIKVVLMEEIKVVLMEEIKVVRMEEIKVVIKEQIRDTSNSSNKAVSPLDLLMPLNLHLIIKIRSKKLKEIFV